MAVIFIASGGDETFDTGLLGNGGGTPSAVSDFVHGSHLRSIKVRPGQGDIALPLKNLSPNVITGAGSSFSVYIYLNVLPSSTVNFIKITDNSSQDCFALKLTNAGVLQLFEATNQIGSDGATLSTGVWYRISVAFTIASTTVNEFRVFKDGISTISVSDATLTRVLTSGLANPFRIGNIDTDANLDFRISDLYIDNSTSLADTGDIWVTAKRPNANGTTNDFSTQIGSGGSGYGSGHSPQVNERTRSDTNGWSMVGAGSAVTEEYNIESAATGDIDISQYTIIDYMGWVRTDSLVNETGQIIVNNVTANIGILSSQVSYFQKVAGSSVYPDGTGTDIGIITSTTVTTVRLYECGVVVAYIPTTTSYKTGPFPTHFNG